MSELWVSYEWGMGELCASYKWDMSEVWVSHEWGIYRIINTNVSCCTWVMSGLCASYEWVISEIWVSYEWVMGESWVSYEWVMSGLWVSYEWVMSELWVSHECELWVSYGWVTDTCDMPHSYVWHDSVARVQVSDPAHLKLSHVTHMCESFYTYKCVMSHSHVCHIFFSDFADTWNILDFFVVSVCLAALVVNNPVPFPSVLLTLFSFPFFFLIFFLFDFFSFQYLGIKRVYVYIWERHSNFPHYDTHIWTRRSYFVRYNWIVLISSTYSRLQIGQQKILRLRLKTFNLVPGEPGFSWDLSWVPYYYLVLIVNPMGRIVVRWRSFRNNLKIFATLSATGCMNKWFSDLFCSFFSSPCIYRNEAF